MRIFTVDSFTDKPFTGNPAGVCILESDYSDDDDEYSDSEEDSEEDDLSEEGMSWDEMEK